MPRSSDTPRRPSREELRAAQGKTIPDRLAPELRVLFVGINPSLYSAAVGRHFARPGNRFWPMLHAGGATPELLSPFEDHRLPEWGYGLTNLVARATARADQLTSEELRAGARRLAAKVRRRRVGCVAFLGVTAYRAALERPKASIGPQPHQFATIAEPARLWVLPNPSGLNAHYQLPRLSELMAEMLATVN